MEKITNSLLSQKHRILAAISDYRARKEFMPRDWQLLRQWCDKQVADLGSDGDAYFTFSADQRASIAYNIRRLLITKADCIYKECLTGKLPNAKAIAAMELAHKCNHVCSIPSEPLPAFVSAALHALFDNEFSSIPCRTKECSLVARFIITAVDCNISELVTMFNKLK